MRSTFFCIDGHTAGNPVRLVAGGAPHLSGLSMSEKRMDFIARYDWIRQGLMFEPRGHDLMSGGFIYPPCNPENDFAILFMETIGCLPMCGHGSIGMITFGLEHGLVRPKQPGHLRIEVPAGLIRAEYTTKGAKVTAVRFQNVASFLDRTDLVIDVPDFGTMSLDIAYGGNFYAIIEPQGSYADIDSWGPGRILSLSPTIRALIAAQYVPVHPDDPTIRGVSHILWADPWTPGRDSGRAAVFYGSNAIDRSPCGTGTSARLAQLHGRGRLTDGVCLTHRSIINSEFVARIDAHLKLGAIDAIIPSIEGSAYSTGFNQIWIDDDAPFPNGFQVK